MVNIPLLIPCVILSVFAVASTASPEDECGITDYPGHHVGERAMWCLVTRLLNPFLKVLTITNQEISTVINGTKVPQGKYPWLVNTQIKRCTGTIVSKKWILTAAHCIKGHEDGMTVSVGSVDDRKGKSIKVKRCIPHEESPPAHLSGNNDIGLLELSEELTYSKDVRRICLTRKRQEADPSINVVITGWGDLTGKYDYPQRLHEGTARVVADSICERATVEVQLLVNLEGRWTQIGVADYVYDGPLDLKIPSKQSFPSDIIH
ncbi:trypsin domain-containing protein [Ditylenchus destructor]|nr:trypsin domain-containing protein [Ditylenchus destructor]